MDQTQESQQTIPIMDLEESHCLFGVRDRNLRLLRKHFSVSIVVRSEGIVVSGGSEEVDKAASILDDLLKLIRQGDRITPRDVEYLLSMNQNSSTDLESQEFAPITVPLKGKKGIIKPKTFGQRQYIHAMANHDIVFSIGPAGTGKTYLAVAAAASALERKEVRRIILCRPAVEAGESLGFLPGDLQAKVDPFLRPLNDALYDMFSADGRSTLYGTPDYRDRPAGVHAGPDVEQFVRDLG